ncbi:MAG: SUMF1/EgtB/PvdO family nonheme iron enzyme [Magnetococcales bacterium]|nr:SUMF1/EgtB/PvdO family nonheme iron enzyme [Magnetococcales bacterium]
MGKFRGGMVGLLGVLLSMTGGCAPLWPVPLVSSSPPSSGKGVQQWPSGTRYEGEFRNGLRHGKGVHVWPDGARYEGDFRDGQRTGQGVFRWPDGSWYEGGFLNGQRHGSGIFHYPDGSRYAGEFHSGRRHGKGSYFSASETDVVCQVVPRQEEQDWVAGSLVASTQARPPGALPMDGEGPYAPPPERLTPGEGNDGRKPLPPAFARPSILQEAPRLQEPVPVQEEPLPEGTPKVSRTPLIKGGKGLPAKRAASTGTVPASDGPPAVAVINEPARRGERNALPTHVDSRTRIAFVSLPGGCFTMGDATEPADRMPAHEVCVESFWMSSHEVTRGAWREFMGATGKTGGPVLRRKADDDSWPVDSVTFDEAAEFIKRLNESSHERFRLPTEAEWEYACRAGAQSRYCGGDDPGEVAWYRDNSEGVSHPVKQKKPNAFGLYDMSGNVWEWTADWYQKDYYASAVKHNPKGPGGGAMRVIRGGAWLGEPTFMEASRRFGFEPHRRLNLVGFRLVREP